MNARGISGALLIIVETTKAGNAVWEKAVNEQGVYEREAVASVLSQREQEQLNRLLRKLLAGFHKPEK